MIQYTKLLEKDKTIKKLQEHVYAKPRGYGFENAFRIIKDYDIDISTSEFNKLLVSNKIIREETYMAHRYISNGSTSLDSDGAVVIHDETALDMLKRNGIKTIDDRQLKFEF